LAAEKGHLSRQYRRLDAATGWHFLTGAARDGGRLSHRYDPERKEFAHAAGIAVLTPKGRIARYFFGVEFAPRDLKFGLMEAAEERIGSPIDQLLLFCYHYDPSTGRYSAAVLNGVRAAGVLTMLALAGFIVWAIRSERRGKRARPKAPVRPLRAPSLRR
jgi:protein SCO1/2